MIDKKLLKDIRKDVDALLVQAGKDHGVEMKLGSGRFGDKSASIKLEIAVVEGGVAMTAGLTDFDRHCESYGLERSHIGMKFKSPRGGLFRITGLNVRAPKYPITAERVSDGRGFKFSADAVLSGLKAVV